MTHEKCALVTGASSGIGRALVIELLNKEYEVIGISRSQSRLEEVEKEYDNPHLHTYACDVADASSVQALSLKLKNQGYLPDLFFLNAGIAGEPAIESSDVLDVKFHRSLFEVNYYGVLNFIEQWLPLCKEKKEGTFVATSSINAIFAPPGGAAYAASKAAISKAFDGLRIAHTGSGVRFLSVFCGPVETPGLVGQLPFTWQPKKMAKYMLRQAEKGSSRSHPSWFYSSLARFLDLLSEDKVIWVLKHLCREKERK